MATLARDVPALADPSRGAFDAGASPFWPRVGAEAIFILALVASCVAVVALRIAVAPTVLIPRDLAYSGVALAIVAAIAAFVGSTRLRRRGRIDG